MNIKRGKHQKKVKLKAVQRSKSNLVNIEKIILKRVKPMDFTVTFTRRSILLKDVDEIYSSARYFQDKGLYYRHIEVKAISPNIRVNLTKKQTILSALRIHDKGDDLASIDETVRELTKYIESIS